MQKFAARTGWLWLKEGIALFRQQPAELSTLFLGYMFLMLVLSLVPVVGQLAPLILVPVFAMAFMQACRHIEQGKRVYPNLLLTGFRSPALGRLLTLGLLYLLAAYAAVGASSLVDGGAFWTAMTSVSAEAKEAKGGNFLAIVVAALIYIPAGMAFWFAAPLIAWQQMPVSKSLFYSFFAVRSSGRAFIVYGLAWLLFGVLLPSIIGFVFGLLFSMTVAMFILLPLSIILTVVMYCSFYPTYTAIFGRPSNDDTPAAAAGNDATR